MIIRQLSVFLENRTGRLTELTGILAEHGINISAFSIADSTDYGILRMIVGKPEIAERVLREKGFAVKATEVICLIIPDKPGSLHHALEILSENDVPVDYMYAFASSEGQATVVIRTDEAQAAIRVLSQHRLELVRAGDIYQL